MKYLKALLVVIVMVFTFGSAMAQTGPRHHWHHHWHRAHRHHHVHQ
jgi:hypothetical protein